MIEMTMGQYDLIYNAFSFAFATLAAATLFFWLSRSQVAPQFRTAMTITGLVTFIDPGEIATSLADRWWPPACRSTTRIAM